ncbi:MAG: pantoate--beta-alanine ligase [Halieaceae bacterium]|nr:pantoate--beta-alanine ligase [Halieaceae bacterium]
MDVVCSIESLNDALTNIDSVESLALVPTMGNLHAGHLSLVARARELADKVVVSIFVNPMQFGANEDLDAYPRTLQQDIEKLQAAGADLLFSPTVDDIYPEGTGPHTQVRVPGLTDILCGASRPGHFDGVTTVVCKLLNLVGPDVAIFGEKDLQQLLVIRKMAADLCIPVTIEGVPIARDSDGLALSSRNQYLSSEERAKAVVLPQTLKACVDAIESGSKDFSTLAKTSRSTLTDAGFEVDYFDIRRSCDLKPATPEDRDLVLLAAARLGRTRLIDNLMVKLS